MERDRSVHEMAAMFASTASNRSELRTSAVSELTGSGETLMTSSPAALAVRYRSYSPSGTDGCDLGGGGSRLTLSCILY